MCAIYDRLSRKMEDDQHDRRFPDHDGTESADSSPLNLSDVIDAVSSVDPVYQALAVAAPSSSRRRPRAWIVEQPTETRFRYLTEMEDRAAGTILGENSTPQCRTYPTIQISNNEGPVRVVVSCVYKDPENNQNPLKYRTHPHALVDSNGYCKKGVYCRIINDVSPTVTFEGLGISCVKKKNIPEALKERKHLNIDPFLLGFHHMKDTQHVNLNAVRLCFQVFAPKPLPPLVSNIIYKNKLIIKRCVPCSGPVSAETVIILLCEQVSVKDHEVVFYEDQGWEALGTVTDVYRQFVAVVTAPFYRDTNSNDHHMVNVVIRRRETGARSEPVPFEYTPKYTDPRYIAAKKKKLFDYGSYAQLPPAAVLRSCSATDSESTITECLTPHSVIQDIWSPESKHDLNAPGSSYDSFPPGSSQDPFTPESMHEIAPVGHHGSYTPGIGSNPFAPGSSRDPFNLESSYDTFTSKSSHGPYAPGVSHDPYAAGSSHNPYPATTSRGALWRDLTTPSLDMQIDSSMDTAMLSPLVTEFMQINNTLPHSSNVTRQPNIQMQQLNTADPNSMSELMQEIYSKASEFNLHDNDGF